MNSCQTCIPLEKIRRIENYLNKKNQSLDRILQETGADYALNGTLYDMKTKEICCHLKADGRVLGTAPYGVYGYAWDQGSDLKMTVLPNLPGGQKDLPVRNYLACTPLILNGEPLRKLTYDPGQGGRRGRSAIGTKGGALCLYCAQDGSREARTPEALRDLLHSQGWDSAVMLDGGGSSQCDFAGQRIRSSRLVRHVILVYLDHGDHHDKEEKPMGKKYKVCLDPGHSASNQQNKAPDGSYYEHEFALDLSKRIKALLEPAGVEVVETRPDGRDVSLGERCRIANAAGVDLFVSLHSNAAAGSGWSSARGLEIYVYRKSGKADQAARAIAERMEAAGVLLRRTPVVERPELYVLKHTKAPALLIEHGFHTNREDAALLRQPSYRQLLAAADAQGILDALGVPYEAPEGPEEKPAPETPREPTERERALAWITESGILQGNTDGDLMLERPLTRQQFAVMLYRYDQLRK